MSLRSSEKIERTGQREGREKQRSPLEGTNCFVFGTSHQMTRSHNFGGCDKTVMTIDDVLCQMYVQVT